ncbi:MAG: hypothetical protein M0T84_13455 [Betaproteobacteria bacterium]|nr:hypothetical protein [Betaproteobacteria bacterium]
MTAVIERLRASPKTVQVALVLGAAWVPYFCLPMHPILGIIAFGGFTTAFLAAQPLRRRNPAPSAADGESE